MIENFWKFPQVQEFLERFPRSKWKVCMESVVLYGLAAIKQDFNYPISFTELVKHSGMQKYLELTLKRTKQDTTFGSSNEKKSTKETQTTRKLLKTPPILLEINPRKSQISHKIKVHNELEKTIEDFSVVDQLDHLIEIQALPDLIEPHTCSVEEAHSILSPANPGQDYRKIPLIDFGSNFLNKHLSLEHSFPIRTFES